MSKESALTDAADYIKKLQKQVLNLQTELAQVPEGSEDQASQLQTETAPPQENIYCQRKLELSSLGGGKLRAKIICENKRGGFAELIGAICSLGLEVTEVCSVAFCGVSQIGLCIEVKDEHEIPICELKELLLRIVA